MRPPVTAVELAARLDVTDKRLRGWLRAQARGGHELLRGHQHGDAWVFTAEEADRMAAEFRGASRPAGVDRSAVARLGTVTRPQSNGIPPTTDILGNAAGEVVRDLCIRPVAAAAVRPDAVPPGPGLYAWWCSPDAVDGLAHRSEGPLHPDGAAHLDLLYVGISKDLPTRLIKKHLGSSTGGSTLRRALAALVGADLGLVACWSPNGDRVTLEKGSEQVLTAWMRRVLHVSWVSHPDPNLVEAAVVHLMAPPCNIEHNADHPNYPRMVAARRAWRRSVSSPAR